MVIKITSEDSPFCSLGDMIRQLEQKEEEAEEWDMFFQSLYNNPTFGKV